MAIHQGTHRAQVAAPVGDLWALLLDYERIPEWQGPVERCAVLERDEQGRGTVVEYEIATPLRGVSYSLHHSYAEPYSVAGELIEGQIRDFRGEWMLAEAGGQATTATFDLRIDPGFWVPGKVVRMLHETVMKRAVEDLKRAAEG